MSTETTGAAFFEAMYRDQADPWAFETSPYERRRYDRIYRALAHRRYRRAFEPGCSIGVLTERLATLCDAVDALDISDTAARAAAVRCAHLDTVSVRCASLAEANPLPGTDLLVLSEIGYYFPAADWQRRVETLLAACSGPTTLVAAHWLGTSGDHLLGGDDVHACIDAIDGLVPAHRERHDGFRLDRWERP